MLLLLGACAKQRGPVEVVSSFMSAVEAFDVATAESLVCEAQRARVRESLEPFDNVANLGEAFDVNFERLSFQERGGDENSVIVHISGTLELSFLGQHEVQDVNEDHLVVRENGRWLVCDR